MEPGIDEKLLEGQFTLKVDDLWVTYQAERGEVQAVRSVSFTLNPGETLAFIGESGCGKTTLGLSLIRLLPATAKIKQGNILFRRGAEIVDLVHLDDRSLRAYRWRDCAMIFQGAQNAFNPVLRIWDQVLDTARAHGVSDKRSVLQRITELFELVQLEPDRVLKAYPHQLSGGMRQRVLIALGLLLHPPLVILDEPTTALDILTQRSVIDVLRDLKKRLDFSLILISHDLSLAAELADRVATMYAGTLVELGSVWDIYKRPYHPYTAGLIRAVPTIHGERRELISIPGSPPDLIDLPSGCAFHPRCPYASDRCRREQPPLQVVEDGRLVACWHWEDVVEDGGARMRIDTSAPVPVTTARPASAPRPSAHPAPDGQDVILELDHVERTFKVGRHTVRVLDDVSFKVYEGEVLCLVGESGCGKTTTGKIAAGLLPPTGGEVRFRGHNVWNSDKDAFKAYRRAVQIIHQDPYASLNPTQRVSTILTAPLLRHGIARNRREAKELAMELLRTVDLTPPEDFYNKYPHQLSGGQRQRVSVARALTVHPEFLVADEAVSMLDVSIRVSLLQLLERLRRDLGVAYLFITHDLAVAKYFAWEGRIAVMYLGRIVEMGPTPQIIHNPQHPYTKALLSALPEADPEATRTKERVHLRSLDVPSLLNVPSGCAFHPRCPLYEAGLCDASVPPLVDVGDGVRVACHVVARERGVA